MKIPSLVFVALQFVFIFLLAMPLQKFVPVNLPSTLGLALLLCGIALALWAAVSLRMKNFSVMPEPVSDGKLTISGPYANIRHPMYSSVMICGIGALVAQTQWSAFIYLIILCVVLYLKIEREELLLAQTYPDYVSYCARTKALIPFLY